jgi:hypothetical protein
MAPARPDRREIQIDVCGLTRRLNRVVGDARWVSGPAGSTSRPVPRSSRPTAPRAPRPSSSSTAGIGVWPCCGRPRSGPRWSPERRGSMCSVRVAGQALFSSATFPKVLRHVVSQPIAARNRMTDHARIELRPHTKRHGQHLGPSHDPVCELIVFTWSNVDYSERRSFAERQPCFFAGLPIFQASSAPAGSN